MRWLRAFPTLLILVALSGPAGAQAPTLPEPEPEVIALPDLASRAEEILKRLSKLRQDTVARPEIIEIAGSFPERQAYLERRGRAAADAVAKAPSLADLGDLENEWLRESELLAAWSRTLRPRAAGLEQQLFELAEWEALWERTRVAAGAAPIPVRERIASVLREIQASRDAVAERRGELLTLQNRVAQQRLNISEQLARIDAAEAELRDQLLEPDSPAAWQVDVSREEMNQAVARVKADLARELATLTRFFQVRQSRLAAHAVLAAVLALAAITLRRRLRARDEDPDLAVSRVIFERPVSAAFLFTWSLAPWLYTRAPGVVTEAMGVLLVIPVLRMLPRLVDPALRSAVYFSGAFVVVEAVRALLVAAPVLERMMLAAEAATAALFLMWLLRPARMAQIPEGAHIPRVLATLIRAGILALVVSLVANVLGYSALARLLGEAVLRSAFGALILYGALRVARAAFRVSLGSQRARSLLMVRGHSPLLLRSASRALSWFALFTWVVFTLEAFSLREALADRARAALGASASFGTIEISLGGIFVGVLTFVVALLLSRLVRFVATEEVFPRLGVRVGAAHAASRAMHYGIVTLGILLALAAFGIDFNRFTLLAGALGVGVGFGLQNIVNNFLSGLILLFERPIQVGDSIEVGTLLGDVKRIGIRSSTVRTWQGAEVIVPNANLISDQVVNWTLSDRQRRVDVPVGVAYGTDPERVLEILDGVAREQAGVLEHPAPRALFLGFGDSSLDFELRAWTPHFESYMATHSDLAVAIYRAFEEAGISIPFPQRDLHVKTLPESLSGALSGSKTRGEE